jgi:DNA-binding NarL/FixJ family response regulator
MMSVERSLHFCRTLVTRGVRGRIKRGDLDDPRLLERMNEGPMGTLSEREAEVVVLPARGLSNSQIATHLHLSEATVKRHLANV